MVLKFQNTCRIQSPVQEAFNKVVIYLEGLNYSGRSLYERGVYMRILQSYQLQINDLNLI